MVYYLGYNHDNLITSSDLERAFFIVTGKYREDDEKGFWKFRERCFGRSIKETISPSIEWFLENGYVVAAVKYYRDMNNCTLMDAKKAIDTLIEKRKTYEVPDVVKDVKVK